MMADIKDFRCTYANSAGIGKSKVQLPGDFFADACRIGIGASEILDISHHSTSE